MPATSPPTVSETSGPRNPSRSLRHTWSSARVPQSSSSRSGGARPQSSGAASRNRNLQARYRPHTEHRCRPRRARANRAESRRGTVGCRCCPATLAALHRSRPSEVLEGRNGAWIGCGGGRTRTTPTPPLTLIVEEVTVNRFQRSITGRTGKKRTRVVAEVVHAQRMTEGDGEFGDGVADML